MFASKFACCSVVFIVYIMLMSSSLRSYRHTTIHLYSAAVVYNYSFFVYIKLNLPTVLLAVALRTLDLKTRGPYCLGNISRNFEFNVNGKTGNSKQIFSPTF